LGLSIGRVDDPSVDGVPGQTWQRGSLSAPMAGYLEFVKGQLKVNAPADQNRFDVTLPIYASLAGIDLAADPNTAPSITIAVSPFAGQFDVKAKNLDQLAQFNKISVADLIAALPNMLSYLQTIDVDKLGLSGLPFIEQSVGDLLDVASVFKAQVIDKVNFNREIKPWQASRGESAKASADLPAPVGSTTGFAVFQGDASVTAAAGQFAASMAGFWVTVTGQNAQGQTRTVTTQIIDVASDGSRLSVSNNFAENLHSVSYSVHQKIEQIQTVDEFIAAVNASGLFGEQQVSYDVVSGDLRLPIRFNGELADLQTPINLGLGEGSPISLSTSATGMVEVDISAGFDLILALGGGQFGLAIDNLSASAGIALAVTDLTVAAQMGFLGLQAGGVGSGSGVRLNAQAFRGSGGLLDQRGVLLGHGVEILHCTR
jgi:hypothetical protein